jgi:hypothetical protein
MEKSNKLATFYIIYDMAYLQKNLYDLDNWRIRPAKKLFFITFLDIREHPKSLIGMQLLSVIPGLHVSHHHGISLVE